ncbi:MAG: hypothetical protein HY811_03125 [Planctomycetes bacterium]|nr:hypothetical protein [Planctomycetota bacterium]
MESVKTTYCFLIISSVFMLLIGYFLTNARVYCNGELYLDMGIFIFGLYLIVEAACFLAFGLAIRKSYKDKAKKRLTLLPKCRGNS